MTATLSPLLGVQHHFVVVFNCNDLVNGKIGALDFAQDEVLALKMTPDDLVAYEMQGGSSEHPPGSSRFQVGFEVTRAAQVSDH